jgi:hypothetical protein
VTIRVEVLAGGEIEIVHYDLNGERNAKHTSADPEWAKMIILGYLDREIEAEAKTRFVTQRQKEAREAWKQLNARSPYGSKT